MARLIEHYGTPRRSGRYPWGSGKDPYQRNTSFLGYVAQLKKEGLSDAEIAKGMGMTRNELQTRRSIAIAENREADAALARRLKDKGYSTTAIAERMGKNESSIRALLDPSLRESAQILTATKATLKDSVDSRGLLDIGVGVENHMGISRTKLLTAVQALKDEGYTVHEVNIEQAGVPGKYTTIKVLAPPGTTSLEAFKNREQIHLVNTYSEDGGRSYFGLEKPVDIDSNRILVKYIETGGAEKDGVIELRRGVDEISLGESKYAQVRIAVDGTHYMKGMAMYADSIPEGYDIIYNTKKHKGATKDEVFKKMESDPDNPFGAVVRQKHYIDKNGKERLSALNMVGYKEGAGEEGSWDEWSRNLSSQILSKQTPALARKQLGLALKLREEELNEILSITNPAVRKALLEPYADGADSDAVHLKAAALPRQNTHVLLPITSLKENEVYAPKYDDGENVVLLRHPHGGIFEIPELKVNNRNPQARRLIGNADDAVGINPKVAAKLSGADFDGDTVIVIPNKNRYIKTAPSLAALKDFDPITAYPKVPGMKVMSPQNKQLKMGDISNLITDMTIRGANHDEIARAVRHSMVVIDSEKHKLNYKQSYLDNNIAELKAKYQGGPTKGASTLISKAGSKLYVDERKEGKIITDPVTGKKRRVYINPKTGEKLYEETGRTYKERKKVINPATGKVTYVETGRILKRKTKTTKGAEVKDAHKLSSGTTMESIYAEHANALKSLANKARLEMLRTGNVKYSRSANQTYSKEVASLSKKLGAAIKNKPLERQAQLLANKIIAAKRKANPGMDPDQLKKVKAQALDEARTRFKANKPDIPITDREWEAIQSGAITNNKLTQILRNADLDALRQRATPRYSKGLSPARASRAKAMLSLGYTQAEVAKALGVSASTIAKATNS